MKEVEVTKVGIIDKNEKFVPFAYCTSDESILKAQKLLKKENYKLAIKNEVIYLDSIIINNEIIDLEK